MDARGTGERRRPIRLLTVVDSLDVGGAERHVVELATALRLGGYEVEVACSASGALSGLPEGGGMPVRPLLRRLVKRRLSLAYAREIRRLLLSEGFDLVHAHVYASAAAAAVACVGTGVPLVLTEHTEARWRGRRARLASRWIYRRARRLIAVSGAVRDRLVDEDGVDPGAITVIPNAVVPAPDALPAPRASLPEGLRDVPLIGVVARLAPEKGVANFLKAASFVSTAMPEVRFAVVGDGPLRGELYGLARRLGLGGRTSFLGFRPDARELLEAFDVLAVPSLSEGAPLVVLEAMAAGVPVVASDVGGIAGQVRHGSEGLLVPPGDPPALAQALLTLVRDPSLGRRMGEAGRRRAAREFGHAELVRKVEAVYRDALGIPDPQEAGPELSEPRTLL